MQLSLARCTLLILSYVVRLMKNPKASLSLPSAHLMFC